MPKFFATTDSGEGPVRDQTPLEYPSAEAACEDAKRALADMAHEEIPHGPQRWFRVTIEDEYGKTIYAAELKLSDISTTGQ